MNNYDDPYAYEQRWESLSPAQLGERAAADPLLFVADHISTADRGPGVVAIHAQPPGASPVMAIVTDGPGDPSDDECLMLVVDAITRLRGSDIREMPEEPMTPDGFVVGLVVHRPGTGHLVPFDHRWARALVDGCAYLGAEPVGVLARTESGVLLRVPLPTSQSES